MNTNKKGAENERRSMNPCCEATAAAVREACLQLLARCASDWSWRDADHAIRALGMTEKTLATKGKGNALPACEREQRLVAGALTALENEIESRLAHREPAAGVWDAQMIVVREAFRALTPADAQAALKRTLAQARLEEAKWWQSSFKLELKSETGRERIAELEAALGKS